MQALIYPYFTFPLHIKTDWVLVNIESSSILIPKNLKRFKALLKYVNHLFKADHSHVGKSMRNYLQNDIEKFVVLIIHAVWNRNRWSLVQNYVIDSDKTRLILFTEQIRLELELQRLKLYDREFLANLFRSPVINFNRRSRMKFLAVRAH